MSRFAMPGKMHKIELRKLKKSGTRLFAYFKLQKLWLLLFSVLIAGSVIMDLMVPGLIGNMADYIAANFGPGFSVSGIAFYAGLAAGLYLISTLMWIAGGMVTAFISQNLVYRLRRDIRDKLDRLPLSYYDRHSRGDILSRINNDTDVIASTIQDTLGQVVWAATSVITVIVLMFITNVWLTLVVLVSVPLYILISRIIMKKSRKLFFAQQTELGLLNGHIEEMYSGHKVVKLYSMESATEKKFDEINERLKISAARATGVSGLLMPALNFVGTFTFVAIVVTGALLIGSQVPTLGIIISFIMYRERFTNPINQVGNMMNQIQGALAASDRVFEMLDEREESA